MGAEQAASLEQASRRTFHNILSGHPILLQEETTLLDATQVIKVPNKREEQQESNLF